jgi:signal transduction histidine kinase
VERETRKDLLERIRDLEERLEEAEETLRALRNGEADAIVAAGPDGDCVYTLRGADEAYRVMVQEMAEGALTVTADGLILFSNRQFARMIDRPLERVIGARFQDFVCAEDIPDVSRLLRDSGAGKAEARLRADDGAPVPVYLSARKAVLNGAECECLIVTDLSEQRRYKEIATVLEAVPAGILIARDVACGSIEGNRTALEMLRMPAGKNLLTSPLQPEKPKHWREAREGRDIPPDELPLQTAARTGERVRDFEFDMLFDDGAYRCWLGNAVPLFDEAGRPRGAVGAFVDVTERKRAAEALHTANAELRNFGHALTRDLREPLDLVVKFTRLLANEYREKPGDREESYIAGSLGGALRIENLLNALVHYWEVTERSGAGLSSVNCNEVLLQVLRELEPEIRGSGAVVSSDELPTVVCDDVMLAEIFRNLIDNSIKYRSEEAPGIHVSAVRTADRWLFSVRDNGIGIDPRNAEKTFGMFRRLHGNEIPGTGIGLALCKKIVERHGGRIWVESKAGCGAAFRFTIPTFLESVLPGFSAFSA